MIDESHRSIVHVGLAPGRSSALRGRGISTSPINAVIVNVVPVNMRATAVALSILAIHLLGDAISPPIIGSVSKALGDNADSLAKAALIVPVAILISGAIWTYAAVKQRE